MTVSDVSLEDCKLDRIHRTVRYLVIGREGSLAIGGLIAKLLRLKGFTVNDRVHFDLPRMLTAYTIEALGEMQADEDVHIDLMVCLNNAGLDYETLVRKDGFLILDASSVTRRPTRRDIETVAVPTCNIVQDIAEGQNVHANDRFDLAMSRLLGALEAVENDYPDPQILTRVFEKLQVEPASPFLAAVYRGYDWLQESWMRGKSCGDIAR